MKPDSRRENQRTNWSFTHLLANMGGGCRSERIRAASQWEIWAEIKRRNKMKDDNPYYSDLRVWLYDQLSALCSTDGKVVPDTDPRFKTWTGMNHEDLVKHWQSDPKYTTCVSFISLVNTRILDTSGLATKRPWFHSFGLNLCGANGNGWHFWGEPDQWPERGDFFQTAIGGKTQHVGVFIEVFGGRCSMIAGGGGTPGKSQSITRTGDIFPPPNLMGWLNIDEFYTEPEPPPAEAEESGDF